MAITVAYVDTQAIGSTEFSIITDTTYDIAANSTADGVYQIFLDLQDMTTSDELQVRVYEKVRAADTQRIVYQANIFGPQSSDFVTPALVLMHGWDVTLDAIAGTVTVNYTILKVA